MPILTVANTSKIVTITVNNNLYSAKAGHANTADLASVANTANYIGTLIAANVVSNAQLTSNLSNYSQLAANNSFTGNNIFGGTTVTFTSNLSLSGVIVNAVSSNANFQSLNVNNTITSLSKLRIGAQLGYNFGSLAIIEVDGSSNSYLQIVNQNANTGNNASTDYIIASDTANDTIDYVDLGINSSQYNQAAYSISGPKDGYLYSSNSNMIIGTASAKEVIFHANGTTLTDRKLTINATSITIANSIGLVANGSSGNINQMLYSNGSALFWANTKNMLGSTRITNTDTSLTINDSLLIANGALTITVPLANTSNNLIFTIKNINNVNVTIMPSGSDTIDGYANIVMQYKNSSLNITSNGSSWIVY
jgi:hypothetical protein